MFEGKLLRVDLPWASAFGWMGDGGNGRHSSRESRKSTAPCRDKLFALFELWWERELECQSRRLGLARCKYRCGWMARRREVLGRRFAATDGIQRRRALADSWGRCPTGGVVVDVENRFEGRSSHGMGIKSRHWVTFKHRIRCTTPGSVVSIEEQSGKREGVGVTRSRGRGDEEDTV
jgi:hypothetical protein